MAENWLRLTSRGDKMAIKTVEATNLLAFQSTISMQMCGGINVIVGENGSGKTSLLKLIYSTLQQSTPLSRSKLLMNLQYYFSCDHNLKKLIMVNHNRSEAHFEISTESNYLEAYFYNNRIGSCGESEWFQMNIPSVFIPTTEMLSHSKGFLALNQKYLLPFDGTQIDIIINASLPEARKISPALKGILEKISETIDGTVVQEDDTFYVIKTDGRKIEFSLEAEGLRKLGLIWKLIRNGLLEPGSILLWDEPEANLNPELFPLVADILLELQKNDVQIIAATHSYNFAKYLEIRRDAQEQVQFHNLYRNDEGIICSNSAFRMEELKPNHIMIADNNLLDEIYDM